MPVALSSSKNYSLPCSSYLSLLFSTLHSKLPLPSSLTSSGLDNLSEVYNSLLQMTWTFVRTPGVYIEILQLGFA